MKLKFLVDRIIGVIKKSFDRPEALAVTSVNTTFIAVLAACLSAYAVYTFSTIQQAELRAIEEAERINELVFVFRHCPFRASDSSEIFDRNRLIRMMQDLIIGRNDGEMPKDIDKRAQKAFGIMSALVNQYPFPETIFKKRRRASRCEKRC